MERDTPHHRTEVDSCILGGYAQRAGESGDLVDPAEDNMFIEGPCSGLPPESGHEREAFPETLLSAPLVGGHTR